MTRRSDESRKHAAVGVGSPMPPKRRGRPPKSSITDQGKSLPSLSSKISLAHEQGKRGVGLPHGNLHERPIWARADGKCVYVACCIAGCKTCLMEHENQKRFKNLMSLIAHLNARLKKKINQADALELCGVTPEDWEAGRHRQIDAGEDWSIYLRKTGSSDLDQAGFLGYQNSMDVGRGVGDNHWNPVMVMSASPPDSPKRLMELHSRLQQETTAGRSQIGTNFEHGWNTSAEDDQDSVTELSSDASIVTLGAGWVPNVDFIEPPLFGEVEEEWRMRFPSD